MNAITFGPCFQYWRRCCFGVLAAVIVLAGANAFAQSTVTTFANTSNKAGAGKASSKPVLTTTTKFNFPAGIALDPSGTLMFVADYNNSVIRMVNNLSSSSSSYTFSYYNSKNGINHPIGIAVNASTNIYVLNYGAKGKNGSLMIFDGSSLINYGNYFQIATLATNLTNAAAIALDNLNNAYITVQGNTVIQITPFGTTTTVGVITNAKTSLTGIAYLANGKVAISDAGNNGIWVMDTSNTNLLGNAVKLTGFHGAGDTNGSASIAAFNHPQGIIAAGNGILVVADSYNNQVKQVDTNGTVSRLFGVNSIYWNNVRDLLGKNLRTKGWYDGTVNPNPSLDTVQSRQPYALALGADGTVYDSEVYYDLLRVATGTGLPPLPPLPPAPPTILLVTTNIGQVTLTWSSISGATNYNVKRSTDIGSITNGSFTTIASTTATTYTDTNVSGGVTYYYVVSALNAGGESANSAAVSATPPQPPVPDPQIGYVDFPSTSTPFAYTSVFHPVTSAGQTFNNDVHIVILGTDGSQTFYNYSDTNIATDVPNPTSSSATAPTPDGLGYHNGLYPSQIGAYTVAEILPNLSIKAVGKQSGRPDSAVVAALFRFVVANPQIGPNETNIYDFKISETTDDANLFYTIDGTDPRTSLNNLSSVADYNPSNHVWTVNRIGTITSNTLFQVYAIRSGYQDSAVVSHTFLITNAINNTIDFGFASGPGSCQFVASPGQTFVVPVALSLLPDAPPIYGLQFNLTVTNLGAIPVTPGAVDFDSLLGKPDQFNDGYFLPIPTYAFLGASQPDNDSAAIFTNGAWYQNLQFTNINNESLLGVGWLEIYGRTNLYNTKSQNLLTYPILRGNEPYPSKTQAVLGGYKFAIPTNAGPGDIYQIQIGRPSGITFAQVGYGTPVLINAPANTNLVGPGSLNALKNVVIGYKKYLVGDVYPANWFNAGDFGTMDLVTNGVTDVSRVFDFAVYPVAAPPANSDLFDALDSCGNFGVLDTNSGYYTNPNTYPTPTNFVNAVTNYTAVYNFDTNANQYILNSYYANSITNYSTYVYLTTYFVTVPYTVTSIYNPVPPGLPTTTISLTSYTKNIAPAVSTLFDGSDTNINQIAFGDGQLDVCDIYVTFRRSLDSSLLWYERFWTNGQLVADTAIRNPAAHVVSKVATANLSAQPKDLSSGNSTEPPQVVFSASNINGTAGQVVQVPITATITGNYNLRLLMLNLSVLPSGIAPALDTQIQFNQTATALGSPHLTDSNGNGNYSAVWLNNSSEGATGAGLTGTVTLGNLYVTIPSGAASGSTYTVSFDHASASPNGLASFPKLTVSGTITVQ